LRVQPHFKKRNFVGGGRQKPQKIVRKSDLSTSVDYKPKSQNWKEGSDNVLARQKAV